MEHTHDVYDVDKRFVIDYISRSITNTNPNKSIFIQHDHQSERLTFEVHRYVDGHDLTLCNKVEIHYTNTDTGKKNSISDVYEVNDIQVDPNNEENIIFTWLVSQNATAYVGSLSFLITFACVENNEVVYRWNTSICRSISIAEGMNNGPAIDEKYPDILTQWKADLFAAIYGVKEITVGPMPPETYPYIWFDTSSGYGRNSGVITIKDVTGSIVQLYPLTKIETVEGLGTILETQNTSIDNMSTQLEEMNTTMTESLSNMSASIENFETEFNDTLENLGESITPEKIGAATTEHTHEIADVNGLVDELDTKAIKSSTSTVLPDSGTALSDNTIYNVADLVGTYIFTPPESGWAHGYFTTDSTVSISFATGSNFVGAAPELEASKVYEFDVYGSVWAIQEVVSE